MPDAGPKFEIGNFAVSKVESSSEEKVFTWVIHAVVTAVEEEKPEKRKKFFFRQCKPLVSGGQIPQSIFARGLDSISVVEVIQLGVSHR